MAKKVQSVLGGCSIKNKKVGFQFVGDGSTYYLEGSYADNGGGAGSSETISGSFLIGQSFKVKGCKACGNKFVYQCGNCGSFVCYDGKAAVGAVCPVCGNNSNVPATTDERIVRSSVAKKIQIVMAMDVSGSMSINTSSGKSRLDDMKTSAINNFINEFPNAEFALVSFGSTVTTCCTFTKDISTMRKAVKALTISGSTASPLSHIRSNFPVSRNSGCERYLVVFTDGSWDDGTASRPIADELKRDGYKIITIGCQGANMSFLNSIASPGANIEVSGDDFGAAYASAAKKINQ